MLHRSIDVQMSQRSLPILTLLLGCLLGAAVGLLVGFGVAGAFDGAVVG